MTSTYSDLALESNAARIAQEARAQARFGAAMDRTKAKIERGLTDVSPREVGESLLGAAKAEQKAVKEGVIAPAYTDAFTKAGDAAIDVSNVVSSGESILGRKLSSFAPESAPDTVRKLLSFKPAQPPAQAIPADGGHDGQTFPRRHERHDAWHERYARRRLSGRIRWSLSFRLSIRSVWGYNIGLPEASALIPTRTTEQTTLWSRFD
jgi:hypothetical protein